MKLYIQILLQGPLSSEIWEVSVTKRFFNPVFTYSLKRCAVYLFIATNCIQSINGNFNVYVLQAKLKKQIEAYTKFDINEKENTKANKSLKYCT